MTRLKWLKLTSRVLKATSATAMGSLIMADTDKYIIFWWTLDYAPFA